MKRQIARRLTAAFLALVMAVGLTPAAFAQEGGSGRGVSWREVSNDTVTASLERESAGEPEEEPLYEDDEPVRVAIVLEGEPTLAMYSSENIAENDEAMAYREQLRAYQDAAAEYISEEALNGKELDVVWNLTLAGNIIAANVTFGEVDAIKELDGIEDVVVETRNVIQGSEVPDNPNMAISTNTTGTAAAWLRGYTGAGMRIAIIDTGLDLAHQSVDNDAFLYALKEDAGTEDADAAKSLYDLLDAEEIQSVLPKLNAYQDADGKNPGAADAENYFYNDKIPYIYNYIDDNFDVTHLNDTQGEHGSHVAGIAAANRYLKKADGSFVEAINEVYMTGNAPDAQLIVMKVFGQGGGAYDTDQYAAIEDAILLGCDAVNLSIGSTSAGFASPKGDSALQAVLDNLVKSDTVVSFSGGNSGYWAAYTYSSETDKDGQPIGNGSLYSDGVNFHTGGSSGSYANGITVAAVQNEGNVSPVLPKVNGTITLDYSDGGSGTNKPLASLDTSADKSGTTYEYVFLDGYGRSSDYVGLDVTDKVVFCSRGSAEGDNIDTVDGVAYDYGNFTFKADYAAKMGAAALIVYNHSEGSVPTGISLNGDNPKYTDAMPVAGISQNAGAAIKAASTPIDGTNGYTGTITIYDAYELHTETNDYQTICNTLGWWGSSWGVPGNLTLKPEIAAPGGNIWSINGLYTVDSASGTTAGGHDQYELMDGTSMAAPHIASISAVVKQYIEENGLSQKENGVTDRALVQSLLMSTATPMVNAEGKYYPVIQQGAGLVNTKAAVSADSYILMGADATDSWQDGKVKAELGDDPDRTGVYAFSFTINNLTNVPLSYTLDADVFTQDTYTSNGETFLSTDIQMLEGAQALFTPVSAAAGLLYDFDGSGIVDLDDGTALLDVVTGNRTESSLSHQAEAHFGRADITSYSAHQFLQAVSTDDVVTVPAGGSLTIRAAIVLDQTEMAALMEDCPNGAYVEAFVKVNTVANAEGAVGTSHTIPVLGFYGSWTDPSMFDVGTYTDYEYGTMDHQYPYLYAANKYKYANYLSMQYAGDSAVYYFGGNPYGKDEEYIPARNALNNQNGDKLYRWYFIPIRNASDLLSQITDADTGEVYYSHDLSWYTAAYWGYNYTSYVYQWYNASRRYTGMSWTGTNAAGEPLAEGTTANVTLLAAPEYYRSADGSVDWEALGKGAALSTQVTIDNTAPEMKRMDYDTQARTLVITAQDNQYIACAALLTADGASYVDWVLPNQETKNELLTIDVDLDYAVGKTFLLQLCDYAQNVRTYELTLDIAPAGDVYYSGFELTYDEWASYPESTTDGVEDWIYMGAGCGTVFCAGAYAKGYVFAFDEDNNFYAMDGEDLSIQTQIRSIANEENTYGCTVNRVVDMAYDKAADTMYFTYNYDYSDGYRYYGLGTIDLDSGAVDSYMDYGDAYYSIAIDDDGTLYGVGYSFDSDSYVLYTVDKETGLGTLVGDLGISLIAYDAYNPMTWDGEKNELLLAVNGLKSSRGKWVESGTSTLYTLDPQTGTAAKKFDLAAPLTALFIPAAGEVEKIPPVDTASAVFLSQNSLEMMVGDIGQLSASVTPWNLEDRTVTWSSSDPDVAAVDQSGRVTAKAVGTAEITAASHATPAAYDTCTVTVKTIEKDFEALLWDTNSESWLASFSSNDLINLVMEHHFDEAMALNCAAFAPDGMIYAASYADNNNDSTIYVIDPVDWSITELGPVGWELGAISDLTIAPHIWGECYLLGVSGPYLVGIDMNTGSCVDEDGTWYYITWDWDYEVELTGIAYLGSYEDGGYKDDCFALVDADGNMYYEDILYGSDGYYYYYGTEYGTPFYRTGMSAGADIDEDSLSYGYAEDGNDYLFWSHYDSNGMVNLYAFDTDFYSQTKVIELGAFPADTWPVSLVTEYEGDVWGEGGYSLAARAPMMRQEMHTFGPASDGNGPAEPIAEVLPEVQQSEEDEPLVSDPEAEKPDGVETAADGDDLETMSLSVEDAAANGAASISGSTVTVRVNLDQASTNGKVEAVYDSSVLTLTGTSSAATLSSFNSSTGGKVVLAYAYKDAAAAGTTVAELTFTSASASGKTVVSLTALEDGSAEVNTSVDLVIDFGGTDIVPPTPSNPIGGGTVKPGAGGSEDKDDKDSTEDTKDTEDTEDTGDAGDPGDTADPTVPPAEITIKVPEAPAEERIPEILAPYTDLNSDGWYREYAAYVIGSGLMGGTGEGQFAPDEPLTRGMLVTILHRAAGAPHVSGSANFSDVASGAWYADGVAWAQFYGLVNGYNDGTFRPNGSITRQELAVILWRLAQKLGIDVGSYGAALPVFSDQDQIASWASEAISWAYQAGILTGYGDGSLAPNEGATRMEAAAMLVRFLQLVGSSTAPNA